MTHEFTNSHRIWGVITLVVLGVLAGTTAGKGAPGVPDEPVRVPIRQAGIRTAHGR